MLPTFVIGLREGIEAALIVGIVAAFLTQRGGRRQLKWMWLGVVLAVVLCVSFAVVLEVISANLPRKQQEGLESVIALVAVGMVTWMIIWMTRNARTLKGELEVRAGEALAAGSTMALVVMAFLAVLREGLETAVFLLAAFQASTNRTAASAGALLGIAAAVVLGWLIYKGGARIDMARFFKVTGLVLVFVAAGLVSFSLHAAWEAGWITFGQTQVLDLSPVLSPGSVQSALVTGVLGIQPKPTLVEAIGWLAYFVPMATFVLMSGRRARGTRPAPSSRSDSPPSPVEHPAGTPTKSMERA